ncbi:SAM-dependent methyltransferase [Nocardia brevicatena]|uniref:SAM-dependent methyltransferase n=1 Tax=Nocardia brevicatena TaxID=37327 RepID=UPI0012F93D6F|nr:SAM-dependent methyltransferase [Nocardia brevicatena]
MTHLATDFDPAMVEGSVRAYRQSGIEMEARAYEGIPRSFRGMELMGPGIVAIETGTPARWSRDRHPA